MMLNLHRHQLYDEEFKSWKDEDGGSRRSSGNNHQQLATRSNLTIASNCKPNEESVQRRIDRHPKTSNHCLSSSSVSIFAVAAVYMLLCSAVWFSSINLVSSASSFLPAQPQPETPPARSSGSVAPRKLPAGASCQLKPATSASQHHQATSGAYDNDADGDGDVDGKGDVSGDDIKVSKRNNHDSNNTVSPIDVKLFKFPINQESLRQLSQNSIQYRGSLEPTTTTTTTTHEAPNQSKPSNPHHQVAFESICGGWRNRLDPTQPRPLAYWVLDERLGALVAKFIYYRRDDFFDIASREAHLTSPIFQPIPAYHSMPDSKYYSTCKATFRSYLTISAHLELVLILVPTATSSGQSKRFNINNQLQQQQQAQGGSFQLEKVIGSPRSKQMTNENRISEGSLWQDHQVVLPRNLSSNSLYQLEFSAMSGPVSSSIRSYRWLNGVAIANFSLSPQCFSMEVDELELARTNSLASASNFKPYQDIPATTTMNELDETTSSTTLSSYKLKLINFLESYKTSIFIAVILILVFVVLSSQWLLCASYHNSHLGGDTGGGKLIKRPPGRWERFLQCFCCCCYYYYYSLKRHRVYTIGAGGEINCYNPSSSGNGTHNKDKLNGGRGNNSSSHLRPVFMNGIFEDVELNENPNYLTNGGQPAATSTNMRGQPPSSKSITRPLEPYHIDRKRLTLMDALGKGAFGEVYQGYLVCYCSSDEKDGGKLLRATTSSQTNLDLLESHSIRVAVKTLTDERMSAKDFIREAVNISLVSHRNIVELIGVCFEEKPFYIIMELLGGGNLKNFLLKNRDKGYFHGNNNQHHHLAGSATRINQYNNLIASPNQVITSPAIQLTPLISGNNNNNSSSLWSLNLSPPPPPPHPHPHPLDSSPSSPNPAQSPLPPPSRQQAGFDDRVRLCMGDLLVFALDIARACDYLQKKQFIHRDLAARNCLLTTNIKRLSCTNSTATIPFSQQQQQDLLSPTSGGPQQNTARSSRSFVGFLPSALEVDANHKVDIDQVFLNGYMNSGMVAKLADFGMTRDIYSTNYYTMANKEMPVRWMPPECFLDGVATTKSDVWSFGVLLWELFSMGQLPYQDLLDNNKVIDFIKKRRTARPKQQQEQQINPTHKAETFAATASNGDGHDDHNDIMLSNSGGVNCKENDQLLLTIADDNADDDDDHHIRSTNETRNAQKRLDKQAGQSNQEEHIQQYQHPTTMTMTMMIEADENEAANLPPLPPPHDNTPHSIYSIMCSCWATNPEDRPQFEEIANRIYWCLQMPEVLNTSLPCFYEPHTPSGGQSALGPFPAHPTRSESRSGAQTQTTQLNWLDP